MIELSFLIPSKDFKNFCTVVNNIIKTCSCIDNIEILVKIDRECDLVLYDDFLKHKSLHYYVLCNKDTGYSNILKFQYQLSQYVKSSLLWLFGDDLEFRGGDWYKEIITFYKSKSELSNKVFAINVQNHRKKRWFSLHPIVSKAWVDCLGYVSPVPITDYFIGVVATACNCYYPINQSKIYIYHNMETNSHSLSKIENHNYMKLTDSYVESIKIKIKEWNKKS